MMKRSSSDSSLDGDDSTVSSKSNRHQDRRMNGGSSVGSRGQEQQVADFSDMPSLASYRADEASLASTLWTDGDQSLPSLSSYRTKDLSVTGSHHSKTRIFAGGVSESEGEDEEEEIVEGEKGAGVVSAASSKPVIPPRTQGAAQTKPSAGSDLQQEAQRYGDSVPRLPRRIEMEDSHHKSGSSQMEDSDSDSASYISDNSPDVSIDTDEEHDDGIEPIREPIYTEPPASAVEQLSPKSQKSATDGNGGAPLVLEEGKAPARLKNTHKPKKSPSKRRERVDPPAEISTPPVGQLSRKSLKSEPEKEDENLSPESPEIQASPPGQGGHRFRVRRKKDSEVSKSKKNAVKGKRTPRRSTSESGSKLVDPKKKGSEKRVRGVGRANSDMAALFLRSEKPEEEKKRGILKRFSSSLKHMVRTPARTKSGSFDSPKGTTAGGKKKSKLKRMSSKKGEKGKTTDEAVTN
eukprot:scaffold3084_cov144-Cylindrotheca_fusiformis.AAC.65